jgi:hypothetical protein
LEPEVELTGETSAAHSRQGAIAEVEAELGCLTSDEIEHGKAGLVVGESEAAA